MRTVLLTARRELLTRAALISTSEGGGKNKIGMGIRESGIVSGAENKRGYGAAAMIYEDN